MEVELRTEEFSASDLKSLLEDYVLPAQDVSFQLRLEPTVFRAPEQSVLVAIVGAGGTALGTVIGGVLSLLAQRSSRKLVIRGKNGRTIEAPADISTEALDVFIEKARDLDAERIEF